MRSDCISSARRSPILLVNISSQRWKHCQTLPMSVQYSVELHESVLCSSCSSQMFNTTNQPKPELVLGRLDVKVRNPQAVDNRIVFLGWTCVDRHHGPSFVMWVSQVWPEPSRQILPRQLKQSFISRTRRQTLIYMNWDIPYRTHEAPVCVCWCIPRTVA